MNLNESDLRTLVDTAHGFVAATFGLTGFEKTEKKYKGIVKFAQMDVNECKQLCDDLNVSVLPAVILFKDAKVAARQDGWFTDESHFIDWLDSQGVKGK